MENPKKNYGLQKNLQAMFSWIILLPEALYIP